MKYIDRIKNDDLAISADTHFFHGNIINYCDRFDFVTGAEKQTIISERNSGKRPIVSRSAIEYGVELMIQEWNKVCGDNTTVIHCGDFAWVKTVSELEKLFSRLNFKKLVIVSGNHDDILWQWNGGRVSFLKEANSNSYRRFIQGFDSSYEAIVNDQHIYFSHYACRVWPDSHRGSWNLYGHTHNQLYDDPYLLSMDVGVDSAKELLGSYRPFTFAEVKDHMGKKKFLDPIRYLEKSGKKDDVFPVHQYEYAQVLQNIERVNSELEKLQFRRNELQEYKLL